MIRWTLKLGNKFNYIADTGQLAHKTFERILQNKINKCYEIEIHNKLKHWIIAGIVIDYTKRLYINKNQKHNSYQRELSKYK